MLVPQIVLGFVLIILVLNALVPSNRPVFKLFVGCINHSLGVVLIVLVLNALVPSNRPVF